MSERDQPDEESEKFQFEDLLINIHIPTSRFEHSTWIGRDCSMIGIRRNVETNIILYTTGKLLR